MGEERKWRATRLKWRVRGRSDRRGRGKGRQVERRGVKSSREREGDVMTMWSEANDRKEYGG